MVHYIVELLSCKKHTHTHNIAQCSDLPGVQCALCCGQCAVCSVLSVQCAEFSLCEIQHAEFSLCAVLRVPCEVCRVFFVCSVQFF